MWVGQYRFLRMNWFWEERRLGKPVLGEQKLGHFYQWAEFWGLGKPVCGDRNWATFINELRSGHIGQFMEISWKINFKLLKWLVWSSGLGRCGCGHRNPASNPEVSPLQLFFYFLIVHYIFTCGPDFAKTKKLTQHSISSQNILFTSKSISLYTQEIIIIKEWLLVTSSLCVESNIYSHLCYQIVFVAWVLFRR